MEHKDRREPNLLVDPTIDRLAHRRHDDAWIAARLDDPHTRLILTWRSRSLFAGTPNPYPVFLAPRQVEGLVEKAESVTLLGLAQGRVYFAAGFSPDDDPPGGLTNWGELRNLRAAVPLLDRQDGALLAYASAMAHWHHHNRFCGLCGSPTTSANAGHLLICANAACGQHHFPRMDPAIIVLVTDGDRCLLGRQPTWTASMYSTIAGFVEPGESLEAAVAREVCEETGVQVGTVHYHSSQPWPFPSSLMLGFNAQADGTSIQLNDGELEDARWFSREEIGDQLECGTLRLPSPVSISFRLVEDWFNAGDEWKLKDLVDRASERKSATD
jgi:NAD+ diphosphatase